MRFGLFSCVIRLVELVVARRYLGLITVLFRYVSVMLSSALWVGRESLSAVGALSFISLPSSRGWTSASIQ